MSWSTKAGGGWQESVDNHTVTMRVNKVRVQGMTERGVGTTVAVAVANVARALVAIQW